MSVCLFVITTSQSLYVRLSVITTFQLTLMLALITQGSKNSLILFVNNTRLLYHTKEMA